MKKQRITLLYHRQKKRHSRAGGNPLSAVHSVRRSGFSIQGKREFTKLSSSAPPQLTVVPMQAGTHPLKREAPSKKIDNVLLAD